MNKFLVGTKALILRNDEVLILKRSSKADSNPSTWDLPGGLLDLKEIPDEAILREIAEETKLEVTNSALISNTLFLRNNEPTVVLFYLVDYLGGEVKLSKEHEEFKWIKISEVSQEALQPWIKEHLKVILKKYEIPI